MSRDWRADLIREAGYYLDLKQEFAGFRKAENAYSGVTN